ncbi:MAG TPA: amino acid adenylation domain-containing protein [Solirubrobacterales bacterium]|nr:amino acid adenylation domain-containing protein [Solirubrobacterales bacterium]
MSGLDSSSFSAGRASTARGRPSLLLERLASTVARRGDAVAVDDGRLSLSYRALGERSDRVAAALLARGVAPGSVVGLALGRSTALVTALIGVLKARCAYLPLNRQYPDERLAFMLEDARAAAVVLEGGGALAGGVLCLDVDELLAEPAHPPPAERPGAEDLAYVIYTSGSTGTPKGVCVTHGNVAALFAATDQLFSFGEDDVWAQFCSPSFDVSVWEMWGALLHGARLVVASDEVALAPGAFLDLIERERVTVLNQVPSVFRYLVREQQLRARDTSALRYAILAGEPLERESVRRWRAASPVSDTSFVNMYGPTEATVFVTCKFLDADALRGDSHLTPIGKPLPHLAVTVVDPQLRPVEPGTPGELCVSGAGVARGYLDRPQLTGERFVPLAPGGPLHYRTGDLAAWTPGGELEHHGRIDDQVKLRGHRIEPGEIEAALLGLGGIDAAAVVPLPDPRGEPMLVAFYVAAADGPPNLSSRRLRERLASRLPRHMLPAHLAAVPEIPLTPSGKSDRGACAARYASMLAGGT